MDLVKIYTEVDFFEKNQEASSFRPSDYCLIFITQGKMQLCINAKVIEYQKGSVVLVAPGNVYQSISYSDDLMLYILLGDSKNMAPKMKLELYKYNIYRIINIEKEEHILSPKPVVFKQIITLIELLQDIAKNNTAATFYQQSIFQVYGTIVYLIMDDLIQNIHNGCIVNTRKEDIVGEFIELVFVHFKEQRNLRFYADKLHISIKYLSNCVSEITSKAPSVFIANALVTEAKTLLLTTAENISVISEQLNFSDQYAFGKFFKKHTGLSPKNFRNSEINKDTYTI